MTDPRVIAGNLAHKFLLEDDPKGWFEALYAGANWAETGIPWAHLTVNPSFADWLGQNNLAGASRKALVIGCGLGDDAEELARRGFEVTAFDISTTAIEWCRRRFPDSPVDYLVADLFEAPDGWSASFDFILEAHTIQALPAELRAAAIKATTSFVAPGGTLLITALAEDATATYAGPPWPLSRAELAAFQEHGLTEVTFEEYLDQHMTRRFRVAYRA